MQIKWDVFTQEEREKINALLTKGHYKHISHAINMDDLEKEYWVNIIVDSHRPIVTPNESKVEEEKREFLMKGGQINTPELEAEWQAKQDAEKAENLAKSKKIKAERQGNMERAMAKANDVKSGQVVGKAIESPVEPIKEEPKVVEQVEPEKEESKAPIVDETGVGEVSVQPEEVSSEVPKHRGRPPKSPVSEIN